MKGLRKAFNANYLQDAAAQMPVVNERNRAYIDRFVSENYDMLTKRFAAIGCNINSSCYGSLDKLNETLLSLYTNPDLCFYSWKEANEYLKNKFTEKEMRIPVKKQGMGSGPQDEESYNENADM